jgi:hypothetical protein
MNKSEEVQTIQLTLDGALIEIRKMKEILLLVENRLKHDSMCSWSISFRNKSTYAYCDCGQSDLRKRIKDIIK